MGKNIKCVLFDLGGVLIKIYPDEFAEKINIKPDDFFKIFKKFEGPISLGNEPPLDVLREIIDSSNIDISLDKVVKCFKEDYIGERIDKTFKLISELREKGYFIGLLSNTNEIHFNYIYKEIDGLKNFDKVYISYKLHLIKPDKKIFNYVENDLKFNKDEIILIDDSSENIDAAYEYGLNTIKVENNDPDIDMIKNKILCE